MKVLRLGTRGSALALAQARLVAQKLEAAFYGLHVEPVVITTSGDRRREESLLPAGGLKTLFTKEIEEGLLSRRIDIAVHSLKDMAAASPAGLRLGATPEREDPRDAWISRNKTPFNAVPAHARIGTSAIRRQAQLRMNRPDLTCVPLRGNVDTRLGKLQDPEEHLDGIILAAAGLRRLGRVSDITEIVPIDILLPAPGQGCLAIQAREDDASVDHYLQALEHGPTRCAITAERAFLAALGGSCQTPIAALATLQGDQLDFIGIVMSTDGRIQIRDRRRGPARDADQIGEDAARQVLSRGASQLLE